MTLIRRLGSTLAAFLVVIGLVAGCRGARDVAHLERGGQAYLAQCAVCHGVLGAGDGPLAASITAEGRTPPAVFDAARVASLDRSGVRNAIETGAHVRAGSPMPVWGPHLGPEWVERITDYVLAMPVTGETGRELVDRYLSAPAGTPPSGRRVYVTYCSSCHGPDGDGAGFFAPAIATKLGPPSLRGPALRGVDDDALTRLISASGAHAPDAATMPGWLYTISPADRRSLVGYLRSLEGTTARY